MSWAKRRIDTARTRRKLQLHPGAGEAGGAPGGGPGDGDGLERTTTWKRLRMTSQVRMRGAEAEAGEV